MAKTLLYSPELQAIRTLDGDVRRFLYDTCLPFDVGSHLLEPGPPVGKHSDPCIITDRLRSGLGVDPGGFGGLEVQFPRHLLIPMRVIANSDWIPVTGSEMKLIVFGAKRRWRSYGA